MNIQIKATKIKLTPEIKEYVQKKMDMLDKYLGNFKPTNCDVEIGLAVGGQLNGRIYRTEVNLKLPGELIRVEKTEKDILKSIDKVKDHLRMAIQKYKGKKNGR
ncbi:MAG: ribosome-associated translation inhibitor RaiA [Patescibacteria group bacterium]|jgi:putative sigma-54 modulation protein